MVDKDTILQIFCGLMKHPQYLDEVDKYNLSPNDFASLFEKYVFSAIYNLHADGAEIINPIDIDTYFNTNLTAKKIFEDQKGVEYLQDALDFCSEENFPFYYNRLKKLNAIRDLKKIGYDTSKIYCEDLVNPDCEKINLKFEQLSVEDIFMEIKKIFTKVETDYQVGEVSSTISAASKVEEVIKKLKVKPEVGAPLQGDIFNTICRGARRTKFYIRSASSGTGKTRNAIGDACLLSYPVRFDPETWEWVLKGSNEKTLFIATEQDEEEIITLILSYLTGFEEEKILYSNYNEAEQKVYEQAVYVMNTFDNFLIVKVPNPNIQLLKNVIRQNWLTNNIKNVFYDYIFSSPSLLNEFRDLRIREDVALCMLSTALKDLAVEMKLFVMSSTQTNAQGDNVNQKGMKDEKVIRGSRAIIDKCDIATVLSRVTSEDLELLAGMIEHIGKAPNQVTDVYKVRRGKYNKVRIWSYMDLGTCRKQDLFVTDEKCRPLEDFQIVKFNFTFDNNTGDILKALNQDMDTTLTNHLEDNKVHLKGLL